MDANKEEKLKEDRICPICLHVWNDPTVLDNCTHIFCFECIIEWTRLKPECPLCKCSLQLVKHQLNNGTALLPTWETNGKIENVIELRSEHEFDQIMKVSAARAPDVEKHAIIQVAKNLMGELHSLRSHSITTFASESIYRRAIEEIDLELNEYKHLLNSINQGVSRATLFNEPAFRRIIYKKNLMPNSISPPMFNVSFNKEYIQNHREAVCSHIMPFIVREVTALTRKEALDIGTYLDRLLDYFTGKIKRQGIVTFLTKKGIENPHQFVNNLLHYASAGQTMHVYDQNSEYTQRRTNYVGAFIPEDDDVLFLNSNSDVEVIGERGGAQNRRRWAQNEQPTAINNNLLLDHFQQQQQQPGTSASIQDRPNGDGGGNERGAGSSFVSRLQAMLNNFGQNFNQNRPSTSPDYFYSPPMIASHRYRPQSPRQEQQPSSSSGAGAMNANQRATFSEANTNLRQHDSTIQFDDSNDDSDDGVECIGVVPKKRREMPEPENNSSTNNDNNDDGEDELMLMDEYEEDEQQQ